MGKGKSFSDFTYGVGLDINASSFKQVKNDLKLNLDNLAKLVQSYSKILKIDPNADLSMLFNEMRNLKSITDGINASDNSFAGFVDKGVLDRIAALERHFQSIGSASADAKSHVAELKSAIDSSLDPLKAAGEVKYPAISKSISDQSNKIAKLEGDLNRLNSLLTETKASLANMNAAYDIMPSKKDVNMDAAKEWLTKFAALQQELSKGNNLDFSQLQEKVLRISDLFTKLTSSQNILDDSDFANSGLTKEINQFNHKGSQFVKKHLNELIQTIQTKRQELATQLDALRQEQSKYEADVSAKTASVKSLGLQSDVTAQVRTTPKVNPGEWADIINQKIAEVEPHLKPIVLRPTFSRNSKDINRELEGNVAKIDQTVKLELRVKDNLQDFEKSIDTLKGKIAAAKQQLEQEGNFKIRFEYEEGGKFKDAAYKIINKFKRIESTFHIANGKKFVQDVARLREKATKELKDIPANIVVGNAESAFASVDAFREKIQQRIGDIGINLRIQNMPEVLGRAMLMRDAIAETYEANPVNTVASSILNESNTKNVAKPVEQLSAAAQQAQEKLAICKQYLDSLLKSGINAPEFLKLGDISADGKQIAGSTKKLEDLLNRYKELQKKYPIDLADRWKELYPEANGKKSVAVKMANDVAAELKQIESELNIYLQKQIAYAQSRYEEAEKVLQKEKEIKNVQSESPANTNKTQQLSKTESQLNSINNLLKDLQTNGFKSAEFLKLGDIGPDGKKIDDTTKRLKRLLNEYAKLQQRTTAQKGAGQQQWIEKYPKANGDMKKVESLIAKDEKRMRTIESELNQYVQKQIAFLSSRRDALNQVLSAEQKITSEKTKQTQTDNTGASAQNVNQQLSMSAEEAAKKVKSLNGTLVQQRKVLKDLEEKGINSSAFVGLGEWDKETGSFKKNKKEMLGLLNQYRALYEARKKAGGTKAVGEEAKTRGKLTAILREQKKHASELMALNQQELEATKAIVAAHNGVNGSAEKSSKKQTTADIETIQKNVDKLTGKLNAARTALSSLQSDGIAAVGSTGLKDTKGVLKNAGVPYGLKEAVGIYNQLIAKKKELENSKVSSQSVDQINKQIEGLTKAKQLLSSKGFLGLTDTQLGDVKGRLGGDPQALQNLLSQYQQLLTAKKEFEKSGDTTSDSYQQTSQALEGATQQLKILHQDQLNEINARIQGLQTEVSKKTEYVKVAQECQMIEGLLADVHKNQVEYAQSRITLYGEQLSKAQELLKVEQQRAQVAAQTNDQTTVKSSAAKSEPKNKPVPATQPSAPQSTPSAPQTSGVVALDAATLNALAKDATLKTLGAKINNIAQQLGKGLTINGSKISISADNVSVTGTGEVKTTGAGSKGSGSGGGKQVNDEVAITTLSSYSRQLVAFEEQIKRSGLYTDTFKNKLGELHTQLNAVNVRDDFDTYKFDLDRFKEDFEKLKTYDQLYQKFINSQATQIRLHDQISTANGPREELQEQLKVQDQISADLENQLKQYTNLYNNRARQLAIEEAIKKANQEILTSSAAQSDKTAKKQNTDVDRIVGASQKKLDNMQYAVTNSTIPMSDAAIAKVKEYGALLDQLKIKQAEIMKNPALLKDQDYSSGFNTLLQQMNSVETEFTKLQKSSTDFFSKIKSSADIKVLGTTFDPNDLEQMHDAMYRFANQAGVGAAKLIEFNDAQRTATFEINDGKGNIQQLTVAYDSATNALGRYVGKTRESLSETKRFLNSLKHSFGNVARYLASFGSVYRLFSIIRQGFTYVKEIDSALTELKKVTDETDASYQKFLQDMSKTGSVVGATVKDLTTMAAEWSRLGYSMEEAGRLAESTAILLNVSEFDDATKASEALISTMQAFQYTADESGRVVDILNEVGELIAHR